jgi:hypothetical protein
MQIEMQQQQQQQQQAATAQEAEVAQQTQHAEELDSIKAEIEAEIAEAAAMTLQAVFRGHKDRKNSSSPHSAKSRATSRVSLTLSPLGRGGTPAGGGGGGSIFSDPPSPLESATGSPPPARPARGSGHNAAIAEGVPPSTPRRQLWQQQGGRAGRQQRVAAAICIQASFRGYSVRMTLREVELMLLIHEAAELQARSSRQARAEHSR